MSRYVLSPYAELMAIRGITQREIAERLGYSPQAVNAWFAGKVEPKLSLKQWHDLAALFGTTIDKLPLSFAPRYDLDS
jgi:transcriptional regulator with XRE-family HTH domain